MKVVIVTSRVTYIGKNYALLFEELYRRCPEQLSAIVLLSNYDRSLLKGLVGCLYLGAFRLFWALLKNTFLSLFSFLDLRVRGAKKLGIPVLRFASANDPRFILWIKEQHIDLVVNARTRCIYREEVLSAPRYGCINIHHGLLPEYRGTMCDLYALYEGRAAGFSIHRMNKKIDDGEIIKVVSVSTQGKDYPHHLVRASVIEGEVLAEQIDSIEKSNGFSNLIENRSQHKVYTKNPTPDVVREMKRKGMKL